MEFSILLIHHRLFVEPKSFDDREWSCTETTNPQIPNEDSELICHGRPGGYKYCD